IYIPSKVGGFDNIFSAAGKALPTRDTPGALIPGKTDAQVAYATLALGSALALFLYPHALTGVLSAKSAQTVRRNAALLPAYSFMLGLIALLGYMAIARGISVTNPNFAVPDLFLNVFPSWFVGVAFAAIAAGWVAGMASGTAMAISQSFKPVYPLDFLGVHINGYTALFALAANLVVATVLTAVLRAAGSRDDRDATRPSDFDELAEDVEPRRRPPEPAVVGS